MGRENVIKLSEVLYLLYCFYYVCLGEETLIGCYSARGAPFVSHKSVGGRRKSIHPGGGLPDITLAAAKHAQIGAPLKEAEVLFAYFSYFCVCFSLKFELRYYLYLLLNI
jgi:hypothetical protein